MKCILCTNKADKYSIFVAGKQTELILGKTKDGEQRNVLFGICNDHLDENGDFVSGANELIRQAILRRVREPGVPEATTLEDLENMGLDEPQ